MKPVQKALLVDLDGTFLDTAEDFLHAFTIMAEPFQYPIPSLEMFKLGIGGGARGMIQNALQLSEADPKIETLVPLFLEAYEATLGEHCQLYTGFDTILEFVKTHDLAFGVVTNKLTYLTEKLLSNMQLLQHLDCVVSGDTTARAKPFPDPLLHAVNILGIQPEEALYVGDAKRDIDAALACGMPALAAAYGYLTKEDNPATWGAKAVIHTPLEILPWL